MRSEKSLLFGIEGVLFGQDNLGNLDNLDDQDGLDGLNVEVWRKRESQSAPF